MIPTSSTTLRNSLSAVVPTPVKNYLVTKVFFSPTVGRVLRLVGPEKTWNGLRFDLRSPNLSIDEVANLYFDRRERAEYDMVRRHILQSDASQIVELGVSIGFIASNLVSSKKIDYFGIEASPRLAREAATNIRNNNRWNSAVRIENLCIDYTGREHVEFGESYNSLVGKLGRTNGTLVRVPATTFGEIVRRFELNDFALISDIEGGEAEVLFQDPESLRGCRVIVAELDNTPRFTIEQQAARLVELGFELLERFRNVFAFRRREASSPPQ
jgi:FkbM family methyltransferase